MAKRPGFTTDIPLLSRWGRLLLFGPGSTVLAHTDEESVEIAELEAAAGGYVRLAKGLLARECTGFHAVGGSCEGGGVLHATDLVGPARTANSAPVGGRSAYALRPQRGAESFRH